MRKSRNKEINVFSVAAIDLFASGMGVFIILYFILIPHISKKTQEKHDKGHSELKYEARMAKLTFENKLLKEKLEEIKQQQEQQQKQAEMQNSQSTDANNVKAQMQMRIDSLKKELQQSQKKLQQAISQKYKSKLQASLNNTQSQTKTQSEKNKSRRTRTQTQQAKKVENQLYIAVHAGWQPEGANIDLIVVDPDGNEFSSELPKIEGVESELVADKSAERGREYYQNFNAKEGTYTVYLKAKGWISQPVRARVQMSTVHQDKKGGPYRSNGIRLQFDGEKKKAMSFQVEGKRATLLHN